MKMKIKNIFASLGAFALIASMGTTVFADTIETEDGSNSSDIKASYNADSPAPDTVYSVDITWGSLDFTYTSGDTQVWNPDTHKFEVTKGAPTWKCVSGADEIKVTNHSNAAITTTYEYTQKNSSGISGSFDKSTADLAAATEGSSQDTAPSSTSKLTLSGGLPTTATTKTAIGSVTVSVNAFVPQVVENFNFVIKKKVSPTPYPEKELQVYTTAEKGIYTVQYVPTKDFTMGAAYEPPYDHHVVYYIEKDGVKYWGSGSNLRPNNVKISLFSTKENDYSVFSMLGKTYTIIINTNDPNPNIIHATLKEN